MVAFSIAASSDLMRPFQLEQSGIRGRIVRLGQTVDRVLTAHDYPEPVGRLLGELLVLAGGLAGGLKFDGRFSLQVRGQGPIRLMVADCTNDGIMRGYASFDADAFNAADEGVSLFGDGLLALTVDQTRIGGEIQQGIVTLTGRSLTEAMLTYFRDSEQIRTGIRVALAREPGSGAWRAGAIILQALPIAPGQHDDEALADWQEAMVLLGTARDDELTDPALSAEMLLYRLFHEGGVRVYTPLPLAAGCSCDESRVRGMLLSFPLETIEEMRLPDGSIEVTCQFCNKVYGFSPDKLADLLVGHRH